MSKTESWDYSLFILAIYISQIIAIPAIAVSGERGCFVGRGVGFVVGGEVAGRVGAVVVTIVVGFVVSVVGGGVVTVMKSGFVNASEPFGLVTFSETV